MLVCLIPFGILLAYMAAATLRAEYRRAQPDGSECPLCDYPRAGLVPEAPCPECGSAPPSPGALPPLLEAGPYPLLLLSAVPVPLIQAATLGPSGGLLITAVTWAIAVALANGWIAIMRSSVPVRRAKPLLRATVIGMLIGGAFTGVAMLLKATGRLPPGEYGAMFDVEISAVLLGPILAAGTAGWCFTMSAFVQGWQRDARELKRAKPPTPSE